MPSILIFLLLSITSSFCVDPPMNPTNSNAYMIIDPKVMSKDVIDAFSFLIEAKKNVEVTLANNEKLTHILNVQSLNGGYLMIFTLKSLKGSQYKIVPLTDIISITSS